MEAIEPSKSGLQLGAKEHLYMKLRPHFLAFFRYYVVGILLIVWTIFVYWMYLEGWLTFTFWNDDLNALMPALMVILGALIMGWLLLSSFGGVFRGIFWISVIVLLVLSSLYIWYWDDPDFATTFAILYGILMGIVAILIAAVYNRAFTYFITNQRIVLQYKMFSAEETTLLYEKVEDFKVVRSLSYRLLGLGTIRAYTGTEDGKHDPDREVDSPKECLYGIRKPVEVKQMLIEIVLERDQHSEQMINILEERTDAQTKEPEPVPEPEPAPAAVAASGVSYYKPAPPPEPEPEPQPQQVKNYERIDPSQYAQPAEQQMSPPGPSHEHTEEPEPQRVRSMYPEAQQLASEFTLEGGGDMDFQKSSPSRGTTPPKYKKVEEEDDPTREVYDEKKPKAL